MPIPRSSRFVAVLVVFWLGAIWLATAFVDQTAATWSYAHLHRPAAMVWLTHLVDPLEPLAIVGLLVAGIAHLVHRPRPSRMRRGFIAAGVAILVAVAIKEQLKYLFGRTWPETWIDNNPSWIRDRAYGFHLLHGGQGWASFPSGHTTQMAALAAVIWLCWPRFRWLAVGLVLAVAIGLWGADFHFVGDILAGALLGAACGVGITTLVMGPQAADSDQRNESL